MSTQERDATIRRHDLAIIGGGSGAEALTRELDGEEMSIIVFEPGLVGGECPFVACMPSKSMLHDSRTQRSWDEAVARREEIVHHRDDSQHASDLDDLGVTLVRESATIIGEGRVSAAGVEYEVDHIVVATGSTENRLDIDGIDTCDDLVWTSADAMTATELPERLLIVGAGVIGLECSFIFARLGSDVVIVDPGDRPFERAAPAVSEVVSNAVVDAGVDVRCGVELTAMRRQGDSVAATMSDGTEIVADRVLVAIGRHPNTAGLGLDALGVDGEAPLPLEPNGRVRAPGSVWAIGDASGHGQYTHLANHHARVVADHLAGPATRRYDDVTQVGCLFSSPPVIEVGPSWVELCDDDDIVGVGMDLGDFPRSATDELPAGHLWLAARRSTGCLVAASGVGPSFDELVHAIVVAVDGAVPVARLQMSMWAFPTIGEILGPILRDLHEGLTG